MRLESDDAGELLRLAQAIAGRLVGTSDVADVAQEAVARAAQRWPEIHDYAKNWIVRVTTNLALDRLRAQGRTVVAVIDDEAATPDDTELRIDVARALTRLPVRQRQVITLRYLADLTEADVARELGCSVGAVKRHVFRAKQALRTGLADLAPPQAKEEKVTTQGWKELGFMAATEPAEGWETRPWDHWFMEGPDGAWDRVAVSTDGTPVLDADGDEVMSGPGFEHAVVKVLPGTDLDAPRPAPSFDHLDAEAAAVVSSAVDEAARWGHPWVGDEHLAVTLLAGTDDAHALDRAIAAFYEGPWADRRLEIVGERRRGGDFVRQPDAAYSWTDSVAQTIAAGTDLRSLRRALLAKEHSLPLILLEQSGFDATHLTQANL